METTSKLAIIACPRSGSTTLANCFMSQGLSVCHEPFNSYLSNNYLKSLEKGISCAVGDVFEKHNVIKHLSCQGSCEVDSYLIENYKTIVLRRKNKLDCALSFFSYLCEKTKRDIKDYNYFLGCYERVSSIDAVMGGYEIFFEDLISSSGMVLLERLFELFGFTIRDKNLLQKVIDDGIIYHDEDKKNISEMFSSLNFDD
jgi:hypothetical protein